MFRQNAVILFFGLLLILYGCKEGNSDFMFKEQGREVPVFSAENAYSYIEQQLVFGPRVPGTEAHVHAKEYFREHFQRYAGRRAVFIQEFEEVVYGDTLHLFNILASFAPDFEDRILLAAHWDTRPRAEEDPLDPGSPILGADDGGSGVAILMEFAAIFAEYDLPLGVDIILFDGEDYGVPSDLDNYFLGSRYWGTHPPVPGYSPRFGILLDMVGGVDAVFPKERHSLNFAPILVDEIWSIAREFGYGDLFVNERGGFVADDHLIVNQTTGIPMINIIHHRLNTGGGVEFPSYWHSHQDNLEIISKETLQATGDVLLELIYNRIP